MKKIYILLSLTLLASSNIYANDKDTLTVYTYDSFVSEWGPGPIIKEIFEEKFSAVCIDLDNTADILCPIKYSRSLLNAFAIPPVPMIPHLKCSLFII